MTNNIRPRSDYLHAYSPCCDASLHRPASSMPDEEGTWFCMDCGKTYTLEVNGYDESFLRATS
jgi:transposase-like protein